MSLQVVEGVCAFLGKLALPLACYIRLAHETDRTFRAGESRPASIRHPTQSRLRLRQRLVTGLRGLLHRVPRRITLDVRFSASA